MPPLDHTIQTDDKLTPNAQDHKSLLSAGRTRGGEDNFSMQIKSVRPPDSADTHAIRVKPYQSDFGATKKMMQTMQMFAQSSEYTGKSQNPS